MLTIASIMLWREARSGPSFGRVQFFPRILDHRDRRNLDIGQLAVDLLDLADVDVLDDVAGVGVDLDRPARAVRVLPVRQERYRLVAGKLALGLLNQIEDRGHPVPAIDGKEVGN